MLVAFAGVVRWSGGGTWATVALMTVASTKGGSRRSSRFDHAVRFVSALSMGGLGAARGCGGGTITYCECLSGSAGSDGGPGRSSRACTSSELDAGCNTITRGEPSGPLPPPELAT